MPFAAAAKGAQRPSGASMPGCAAYSRKSPGVAGTVAPPASASVHSFWRSARAARCMASSDDEQAVSTVSAGPSRPSRRERRPEARLPEMPEARCPRRPAGVRPGSGSQVR